MNAPTANRGMFAATGNASTVTAPRDPDDFVRTPPGPLEALLDAERGRLARHEDIWEPAAGDGALLLPLSNAGYNVFASDIVDRGCNAEIRSFFDFADPPARAIITNPPYYLCNWRDGRARWIRHALETLRIDYMALLLDWRWPAAGNLEMLWETHPPARVHLCRWRIDWTGGGSPPGLHAWFVWDRWHYGATELHMLSRPQV